MQSLHDTSILILQYKDLICVCILHKEILYSYLLEKAKSKQYRFTFNHVLMHACTIHFTHILSMFCTSLLLENYLVPKPNLSPYTHDHVLPLHQGC